MPTSVRSHAKINLGLGIGAPRPDGFHALATVYQTIELYDLVTVMARPSAVTSLRVTSNDERVPTDGRNTAWKMVELALKEMGLSAEVEIHIEKRLPVQGGLGAGSANAVAALVGLEAELLLSGEVGEQPGSKHGISRAQAYLWQRLEIAAKVGSDVPLFLIGVISVTAVTSRLSSPLRSIVTRTRTAASSPVTSPDQWPSQRPAITTGMR